jgi:hypothetical protein
MRLSRKNGGIMKKLFLIFLILLPSVGITANDGIGISTGFETGIENINNKDNWEPYIMPIIIFDQTYLDGALDVFAELDYTFGFSKVLDKKKEVYPQSLYFDLLFAYNQRLDGASTLSFIVENEFDEFIISPSIKNNIKGILTPAVKFTQEFNFGDIYGMVGSPVTYIDYDKKADIKIGIDFTIGWYSTFGPGLEAKALTLLMPGDGRGYLGLEALATYETGPIYFEVLAEIPKEISGGVTITPEFEFNFGNITFYAYSKFAGLGGDGLFISPAIGVKFNF